MPPLLTLLKSQLSQGGFSVHTFPDETTFVHFLAQEEQNVDCLVLEAGSKAELVLSNLQKKNVLLPCVLINRHLDEHQKNSEDATGTGSAASSESASEIQGTFESLGFYHPAIQLLSKETISDRQALQECIEKAINRFLHLPAQSPLLGQDRVLSDPGLSQDVFTSLSNKQRRLSVKLQERLGYLGVYYKRNPASFLRQMNREEKHSFLTTLRKDYREIILNYFSDEPTLNQKIDSYVTTAFFADVPTAQMVQIHMELMDEFANQLKLEGRNEEILLDYRLTLIDMLANLCELYRRSIPRL